MTRKQPMRRTMVRKRSRAIFRQRRKRRTWIVKSVKAGMLSNMQRTSCEGQVDLRESMTAGMVGLIAYRQDVPRHNLPIPHIIFCPMNTCGRRPGNVGKTYHWCYARSKPYSDFATPCFVNFFYYHVWGGGEDHLEANRFQPRAKEMLKEAEFTALKVMVMPLRSKSKRGATKSEKLALEGWGRREEGNKSWGEQRWTSGHDSHKSILISASTIIT